MLIGVLPFSKNRVSMLFVPVQDCVKLGTNSEDAHATDECRKPDSCVNNLQIETKERMSFVRSHLFPKEWTGTILFRNHNELKFRNWMDDADFAYTCTSILVIL